jgi:Tat protein secretion system quality control protein TatD with DNase activity
MNTKITSLNRELMQLQMCEQAITESTGIHGKAWSKDARRQLEKHKGTIRELIGEYGLDGYEWMFSNDRGML